MLLINPAQVTVTAAISDPSGATTSVFSLGLKRITIVPPATIGKKLRPVTFFNRSAAYTVFLAFGKGEEDTPCAYEVAPKGLFTIGYLGAISAFSDRTSGVDLSVTIFEISE